MMFHQSAVKAGPGILDDLAKVDQRALGHAMAEYREAIRLKPEEPSLHIELGRVLLHMDGKPDEAMAQYREAKRLEPKNDLLHSEAALAFSLKGRTDEALSEVREAIRIAPKGVLNHMLLGSLLQTQGKTEEAFMEFRKAYLLDFFGHPSSLSMMRKYLHSTGKANDEIAVYRERIALCREAIRVKPDDARAHQQLASELHALGMQDEAVKEFREVVRISPSSNPFGDLAAIAYSQGKVDQAISLYREAIRLKPQDNNNHNNLGYFLLDLGETDAALSEIREALRIQPKDPNALDSLGWAHLARGELKEALLNLREANRLQQPLSDEIRAHLLQAERLSALEGRLETILRGKEVPTDAGGRLDVADLCRLTGRFTAATGFYREAFQAKPALVDDLSAQHRFHAALAAAQAGMIANRVKDAPAIDDAERSQSRVRALEWLRAERDACAKLLTQNSHPQRNLARKSLDILKHHRDLAALRDEAALKKLPEAERKKWQDLWTAVDTLLKKADRP